MLSRFIRSSLLAQPIRFCLQRVVLDHGGDQAVRLGKIQIHGQKQKKPADFRGGRPFRFGLERLGQAPSHMGMLMMRMPGDVSQCHKEKV